MRRNLSLVFRVASSSILLASTYAPRCFHD
jgi:hypothetical protein